MQDFRCSTCNKLHDGKDGNQCPACDCSNTDVCCSQPNIQKFGPNEIVVEEMSVCVGCGRIH